MSILREGSKLADLEELSMVKLTVMLHWRTNGEEEESSLQGQLPFTLLPEGLQRERRPGMELR